MIKVVLALGLASIAACSDDATCGPSNAPASGVTLTVGSETVTYGGFSASVNNDCTIAGSGVISVSIHGAQDGGAQALSLCLPRPDLIAKDAVPLQPNRNPPDAGDRVQLVDVTATLTGGCTVTRDTAAAPSGTATFRGYCGNGDDPAGYALALSGQVMLRRTCGTTMDTVSGTLGGEVAVAVN